MRKVLIWRNDWLPWSETFISRQLDSYGRYEVQPGGLQVINDHVDPDDVVVAYRRSVFSGIGVAICRYGLHTQRVKKLISTVRPNLIHVHFATDAMAIYKAAKRLRIPYMVTVHGFDASSALRDSGWRSRIYRQHLLRIIENASLVLCVSQSVRQQLIAHGVSQDKLTVHYLGIPPQKPLLSFNKSQTVLAVGRLTEKKGFGDLIEAFTQSDLPARGWQLHIVGSGPEQARLAAAASSLGNSVTFLEHMSASEILSRMSTAGAVCVPSKVSANGDKEGLPTVAVEAAWMGAPLIASDHGGLREVVGDNQRGLAYREGDVAGLRDCLNALLQDAGGIDDRALRLRQFAEDNFDMIKNSARLEDLYDNALQHDVRRDDRSVD